MREKKDAGKAAPKKEGGKEGGNVDPGLGG